MKSTLWQPNEPLTAECLRDPPMPTFFRRRRAEAHAAPGDGCECGIYAGTLAVVGTYIARPTIAAVTRVVGKVLLWGTVVECERGFRASHAYPARLYLPVGAAGDADGRWGSLAFGLVEAYDVPVEFLPARPADAPRVLEQMDVATSPSERC